MEVPQHTLEEALETLLWLQDSFLELELKANGLVAHLEREQVDSAPALDLFKIISEIRFHLEEAEEYSDLVKKYRKHKRRARLPGAKSDASRRTAAGRQFRALMGGLASRLTPRKPTILGKAGEAS